MEEILAAANALPPLPSFFTMFLAIYLIAYFVVFRSWTPETRPEAASCLISLFHGTPAAVLAAHALISDPDLTFSSPNTPLQALVLDFSLAYFLTDLLHYVIFYPSDVTFIAHHVATLYMLASCRHLVGRGSYAILALLVLAEVTSACQNAWTLARARRHDATLAAKVYGLLSPPFYAFYSVVRGIVAPAFVCKMGIYYISGEANGLIPKWIWISWMTVVIVALMVSILWISARWSELSAERTDKLKRKMR